MGNLMCVSGRQQLVEVARDRGVDDEEKTYCARVRGSSSSSGRLGLGSHMHKLSMVMTGH